MKTTKTFLSGWILFGLMLILSPIGSPQAEPNERTLEKIYVQIALNVNYSPNPAEQRQIIQTVQRHLDLMNQLGSKANYYLTLRREARIEVD
jgi:hypothetical protein